MAIVEVSPQEAAQRLGQGWILLDVRTPGEWSAVHAKDSVNLPLDALNSETLKAACGEKRKILAICQSGGRSKKACELLQAEGGLEIVSVAGGTKAWQEAGLPVEIGKGVISIERQVRIGAGTLVVLGSVLGLTCCPGFFALPLFVGAGLIFAGVTDFCGMALLLSKMPWNQRSCCGCKS